MTRVDPESEADQHTGLKVHTHRPYNAGPGMQSLGAHPHTPNDLFFVRSHGDIPHVDAGQYYLRVEGLVRREVVLSLQDLAELPRHHVVATVQCAGNRRDELNGIRPTHGAVAWGGEAIGTATWEGYALTDLLARVEPTADAAHVEFEGLDVCEHDGERFCYGTSIPIAKATSSCVLLADTMNDAALPVAHGAPLRLVVPGYIGARSVKWLSRIRLRADPSHNYFHAVDYRLPVADGAPALGPALTEQPVNSMICTPTNGATVTTGTVTVSGWAYAGGRSIARVDVTTDGGQHWVGARLGPELGRWAWRFWEVAVSLPAGRQEIAARAFDEAANSQPERLEAVWNSPGYVNNAWSRITVEAC